MYWTNFAEEKILKSFLGVTTTAPTAIYAACLLSNPGETGGGTEITYTGYQRPVINFSVPSIGSSGATTFNTGDVVFPTSTTSAGTITYCGLFDAQVGGNMWAYVVLDEPIVVTNGVAPLIQAKEWNYISTGNFSNSFKIKTLNLLRGVNLNGFTPYFALYNGSPDSGGAELAGASYARFAGSFGNPAEQSSGQMMITINANTSSPRATEYWGDFSHMVIYDASSAGEVVTFKQRPDTVVMGRGKAATIKSGEYSVSVA